MQKKEGLLGVGIGAALVVALGAVSFLVKPSWPGLGQPRVTPGPETANRRQAVHTQPLPLPADFDEQCRAAGI